MQGVDREEHFGRVEAGVFVVEDARGVDERAEVAARDVFHCEVDVFFVLECVEELD
jgi:hypothetical protein